MKKVTIVILTHNSERFVDKCLGSIFAQSYSDFDVVVLDNASLDSTVMLLKRYPVQIVQSTVNLGWAKGNNVVLKKIATKYAVCLNIDTIVAQDWLGELVSSAERGMNIGAVSSALFEYEIYPKKAHVYPLYFDASSGLIVAAIPVCDDTEVSFVPGTALLLNMQLLGQRAYFREDFYMYHEDVEFSLRILTETDLKLTISANAKVWHYSKGSLKSSLPCKMAIRNLMICLVVFQTRKEFVVRLLAYFRTFIVQSFCYMKYYPFWYPISVCKAMFRAIHLLVRGKSQKNSVLHRLQSINLPIAVRHKQSFRFIF